MHSEPDKRILTNPIVCYALATRFPFLAVSAVACTIGWASAYADGVTLKAGEMILTLIGALLAHAGVNVLNDYYDSVNGTDDNNQDRLYPFTGGSRFIQNGLLTREQTAVYGITLLLMAVLIGAALALQDKPALWIIGAVGILIGWSYSAPPLSLNSRGLGELSVATGFGVLIPLGADYVLRNELSWQPVMAGISYALLVTNILFIAQFPDRRADARAGKTHWVVRLEPGTARWGYLLLAIIAYGYVLARALLGQAPLATLWALLPAILSLFAAIQLLRYSTAPQQLMPAISLTVIAALLHGALLSITLPA